MIQHTHRQSHFRKETTFFYFYLFVFALSLGLVSVELFSEGMFMDGLYYATISRNMSLGMGSFWKPYFSATLFKEFYEHPPLALGLQSICFRLFGDSLYVERFYSFILFLLTGGGIVLLWKQWSHDVRYGWLPLLFWVVTGGVIWSVANNMLENTMVLFVVLSVFFYGKRINEGHYYGVVLAGLSLSLGLLTKGFPCLYVWSLPFFMWLFLRKPHFMQMITDSLLWVGFTLLPIMVFYLFVPDARHFMQTYLQKQVIGSIEHIQTVSSRWAIVRAFFESIVFPVSVAALSLLFVRKRAGVGSLFRQNRAPFFLFFAVSLAGVLPIMVSMKQRPFYITTVYPFFAMGLALLFLPFIRSLIDPIPPTSKGFTLFKRGGILLLLVSVGLSVAQVNRVGRDNIVIHDVKQVIEEVGHDKTIHVGPNIAFNWGVYGYFSRYGNVSLSFAPPSKQTYYLSSGKNDPDSLDHYQRVETNMKQYRLYKTVDPLH
ncbi:MAG: hypothetical protein CSA95_05660 [Bacteroidetes bacterium]|nr:MAG: hypothetical protein CSA95_05660 [Bacteroidota bacterium]